MADFVSLDGYNVRDDNAIRKVNGEGTGKFSINRRANTTAGSYSTTFGDSCTASGSKSFATGTYTTASGLASHTEGSNTTASATNAHAEGSFTEATGNQSHAEGSNTVASGDSSHAEGYYTKASSTYAHAEGYYSEATASTTHAEGNRTKASYRYAHVEGSECEARAEASHAQGSGCIATGRSQHVAGENNIIDSNTSYGSRGTYVEIIGNGTTNNNRSNARTLDWLGNETIAGTLTQNSDARLKVIHDTPLPDLSAIDARVFNWLENTNHDDKDHIGYIAQDVEAIAPYLVREDANGYKSLDYIAVLVAKVAALEARVRELETNAN